MSIREIKLGPKELTLLFTLEKEGRSVFGFQDVLRILDSTQASAWNVIYRLKKKGRIEELQKGKYLLIPARAGVEGSWSEIPYILASYLINNYYVGLWSALNYWGMTEQAPRTLFVVTVKQKKSLKYGPVTLQFVKLAEHKFFGWISERIAGRTFNVSDREKTIVDSLALPQYAGGIDEVIKGIWNGRTDLDFQKLLHDANRYRISALLRRLGYSLDILGLDEGILDDIASTRFDGYRWLDPAGPKRRLGYSKNYGLILNRHRKDLLTWRES